MLTKVNVVSEVNALGQLFVYKKIARLNEHVLSVVQVENRTLDFHVHDLSDELFYVIVLNWKQRKVLQRLIRENLLLFRAIPPTDPLWES